MSATEEPTVQPTETKQVEAPVAESPTAVPTLPETPPETAILSKDPIVVAENLEKADPITTEAIASSTLAAAETSAPEEATTENAPATPEKHKEGSNLLKFMKKYVPNPKGGAEKKTPVLAG